MQNKVRSGGRSRTCVDQLMRLSWNHLQSTPRCYPPIKSGYYLLLWYITSFSCLKHPVLWNKFFFTRYCFRLWEILSRLLCFFYPIIRLYCLTHCTGTSCTKSTSSRSSIYTILSSKLFRYWF